jgi:hypothetical protein
MHIILCVLSAVVVCSFSGAFGNGYGLWGHRHRWNSPDACLRILLLQKSQQTQPLNQS